MINKVSKNTMRISRHVRIRETITGTKEMPRLNVFRSNMNITAQLIDDVNGVTLASASSLDKDLKITNGSNTEAATLVGAAIAKRANELKIKKIVFDRGGYLYHGRVKALADAARENGLEF